MQFSSEVPHLGVYMPAEVRLMRGVVRQVVSGERRSPEGDAIAQRVARRVFRAYSRGESDRSELLRLGLEEKMRMTTPDLPARIAVGDRAALAAA